LQVLDPLEVTDGDAAGVAEDVGNEENIAALFDDGVGFLSGWAISGFGEDFAAELCCVVFGDDPF